MKVKKHRNKGEITTQKKTNLIQVEYPTSIPHTRMYRKQRNFCGRQIFSWVPLPTKIKHTKIKHTKICLQRIIKTTKISHVGRSEELGEDDAVAVRALNRWSTRLRSKLGVTCLLATGLSYCMRLQDRNVTPSWLSDLTSCQLTLCAFEITIIVF